MRTVFGFAIALAIAAPIAHAGDLAPPLGPVAPTMKTLHQVEPSTALTALDTPGDADSIFRITTPGAYHLTANLTGEAGKHAIEVATRNVVIDLRGFSLIGVPGSLDGVSDIATLSSTVRNGTIRLFGGTGVSLPGAGSRALDLDVESCGGAGVYVGDGGVIRGVVSRFNGGDGLQANSGRITGCTVRSNGGFGVLIANAGLVADTNAFDNSAGGFRAFGGTVFERCDSFSSTARGFEVGDDCVLRGCRARFSRLLGIVAGEGCVIEACLAESCNVDDDPEPFDAAIKAGDGSIVRGCISRNNASTAGILVRGQSIIEDCQSIDNGTNGISALDSNPRSSATIARCVATGNGVNGIVARGATVTDCSARANGSAGIALVAGGVAESCEAHDNDTGIEVSGDGGVVRGCHATGNSIAGIAFIADGQTSGGLAVDCSASGNADGISAVEGSAVVRCVVRDNARYGIIATNGSRVEGCTVSGSTNSGILAFTNCQILYNTCSNNAAGLVAPEANIACSFGTSRNRVEGNHVVGAAADTGIRVDQKDSLIIRNTVSGCGTPYDLGLNSHGPIVDVSAASDISAVPGADHPWANFVH